MASPDSVHSAGMLGEIFIASLITLERGWRQRQIESETEREKKREGENSKTLL